MNTAAATAQRGEVDSILCYARITPELFIVQLSSRVFQHHLATIPSNADFGMVSVVKWESESFPGINGNFEISKMASKMAAEKD